MSTDTETLSRALAGIPDEFAPTTGDKRNAWSASSFTLVSMLRGLGDAAPNRYTYTFDYGDGEDFEISVSRVRGVSQLAALREAEVALATVTRERDEARAMVTEYRTRVDGIETERVWAVDAFNRTSRDLTDLRAMYQDAQTELGRTAEAIHGEPADAHCLHEWAAEVVRERDELRAVGRRLLTAYGGGYFVRKPTHPWESPMVRQDHACHECAPDAEPGWRCPYHELRALLGDDTALAGAKS